MFLNHFLLKKKDQKLLKVSEPHGVSFFLKKSYKNIYTMYIKADI